MSFAVDNLEVGKTYKVTLYIPDRDENISFNGKYRGNPGYGHRFTEENETEHLVQESILIDAEPVE